jgi:molybdopterin-guanine dinucleotide biosynthesis protein A
LRAAFPRPRDSGTTADLSVRVLQHELSMPRVRLKGVRLGNLNTPADLAAVRARLP